MTCATRVTRGTFDFREWLGACGRQWRALCAWLMGLLMWELRTLWV